MVLKLRMVAWPSVALKKSTVIGSMSEVSHTPRFELGDSQSRIGKPGGT